MKQLLEEKDRESERRKKLKKDISGTSNKGDSQGDREDSPNIVALTSRANNCNTESQRKPSKRRNLSYSTPQAKTNTDTNTNTNTPSSQPCINNNALVLKDVFRNARISMAKWWYDAKVPFNGANSPYFEPMLDAIIAAGTGFKAPTFHDLRGPLLKEVAYDVRDYLSGIKKEWMTYGCSVMIDRWTNERQESIMNFLVYSSTGTMFLKSVDVSGIQKDEETLLVIFDGVVREIGPENIVQFVSDNDASFRAFGESLQQRYRTFFWSPCAAHFIDLMLEKFADPMYFPVIDETIKKARRITKYIYNHAWVLALMRREFTNGHDLCHPGITRFATHFLSLQCLLKFKKELCQMFTSCKWVESSHAKSGVGKEIASIILKDRDFWANCQHSIEISKPLVRVLCLLDSKDKPCMGYLYEAINVAKETIKTQMKNKASLYGPYVMIIDTLWDKQMCSPLHAAGCFLNPSIFFRPSFTKQKEVTRGLLATIIRLVRDIEEQDKICSQVEGYKKSTGDFGMSIAIRQREKLNPIAWWEQFGNETPELQMFAIRVLSQCCSATGCERNRSTFEFIHSKRQSRVEHKRLNDLVFVHYNLKLRERNARKNANSLDPISLDNIDLLGDWVSEEPGLLDREDINWEMLDETFSALTLTLDDEELPLGYSGEEPIGDDLNAIPALLPPQDLDSYNFVVD